MNSKLSKFFIIVLSIFIFAISLVPNTYCLESPPDDTYILAKHYVFDPDGYPDFYNYQNSSIIEYTNFRVSWNNGQFGNLIMYIPWNTSFGQFPFELNTTKNYHNLITTYEEDYDTVGYLDENLHFSTNGSGIYYLYMDSINIVLYDGYKTIKPLTFSDWTFFVIPSQIISYFTGRNFSLNFYGGLQISFDINFHGQYYYNDMFFINTDFRCDLFADYYSTLKYILKLTDNNGFEFTSELPNNHDNFGGMIHFINNFNSSNSYVKTVSTGYSIYNNSIYMSSHSYTEFRYFLFFGNGDSTTNPRYIMNSYNSQGQSTLTSSSLPSGNLYYRKAEWYDIPTHLYNFMIYLLFDAPVISDILSAFYVVIQFVIQTLETFVGFFFGINNSIFIAIFIGMIAISIILSMIFGGHDK